MKTPITKRPPRKAKRWFPYPEGNWLEKIVGVTILALTVRCGFPYGFCTYPFDFIVSARRRMNASPVRPCANQLLRHLPISSLSVVAYKPARSRIFQSVEAEDITTRSKKTQRLPSS
jgi:hypothetical protein